MTVNEAYYAMREAWKEFQLAQRERKPSEVREAAQKKFAETRKTYWQTQRGNES